MAESLFISNPSGSLNKTGPSLETGEGFSFSAHAAYLLVTALACSAIVAVPVLMLLGTWYVGVTLKAWMVL